MKKTKQQRVILHGEAKIVLDAKLPSTARRIPPSNPEKGYHIIAPSETTGNHHVIDAHEGIEFYMDDDGQMFMVAEKPTNVRCVMEHRHGTIPLNPGVYEFGSQKEFNYYKMQKEKVRD